MNSFVSETYLLSLSAVSFSNIQSSEGRTSLVSVNLLSVILPADFTSTPRDLTPLATLQPQVSSCLSPS